MNLKIAATISPRDREIISKAKELKSALQGLAEERFKAGVSYLKNNKPKEARGKFLTALRFDPGHKGALDYLKNKLSGEKYTTYEVKKGDTLKTVAKAIYKNPGAHLLIARVNGMGTNDKLNPGTNLKLPVVQPGLLKIVTFEPLAKARKKSAPSAAEAEDEGLSASSPGNVDMLLSTARIQYNNKLYETAASVTEEILALDPENKEALTMQRESYYQVGMDLKNKENNLKALKMFQRLSPLYKDTLKQIDFLKKKINTLSEPHYVAGMQHFLDENLEMAVEEWRTTLEINPYHAKAKAGLKNALKLLEAVKKF
ncbi:MAG: LysM peptidoglycan-binding domain-containing protein, partial [Thermodesulfobacteriota bacterium]|nr:LysM peptidoglycan-binding domain-containing protein [Thermodesulfobacteriota bacterium]